jgi:predicted PurR-regulated permease PerM
MSQRFTLVVIVSPVRLLSVQSILCRLYFVFSSISSSESIFDHSSQIKRFNPPNQMPWGWKLETWHTWASWLSNQLFHRVFNRLMSSLTNHITATLNFLFIFVSLFTFVQGTARLCHWVPSYLMWAPRSWAGPKVSEVSSRYFWWDSSTWKELHLTEVTLRYLVSSTRRLKWFRSAL